MLRNLPEWCRSVPLGETASRRQGGARQIDLSCLCEHDRPGRQTLWSSLALTTGENGSLILRVKCVARDFELRVFRRQVAIREVDSPIQTTLKADSREPAAEIWILRAAVGIDRAGTAKNRPQLDHGLVRNLTCTVATCWSQKAPAVARSAWRHSRK